MRTEKQIYIDPYKPVGLILLLLFLSIATFAQKERKFIREGNSFYKKAMADTSKVDSVNFEKAEIAYRKALDKKPGDFKAQYNVANALYKQNKTADSQSQYEQILNSAQTNEDRAKVFFNIGNTFLSQQKFDESIEAYKNALRNNPKDVEAKYNLEFARRMKKQKEEQDKKDQEKKDQNKDQEKDDKNKDQNKDQQDQNKDKQDPNKDKQDQNKDKQDQNKDKQDQNKDKQDQKSQNQQKPQNKISQQNAEQMLKALQNDEKQTQEKVNKAKAIQVQSTKNDKDW